MMTVMLQSLARSMHPLSHILITQAVVYAEGFDHDYWIIML
jgi:hypothetical protein